MKHLLIAATSFLLLSCSSRRNELDSKVQTLEFHYINWACECANWATLADIRQYEGDSLAERCVFIEPADSSLALPDTIGFTGDIVQFTGQYYKHKGFPEDYVRTEEPVEKAAVFRYTAYKIISSNHRESLADQIDSAKYMIDKGALNGSIITLDVSYAAIMCSCPQWFETKYANDTSDIDQFYLEPANSQIVSADELYDGNNLPLQISVTGRFYLKEGYPENYFPAKGNPSPARVFRYDRIRIIKKGTKKVVR